MTVAIVGVAESDLGETNRSILGLQTQAITRALDDAGLQLKDIDGIAAVGIARFSATQTADYLGIQPSWSESTFAGGSAFETYVARAAQAIDAGQCDTVLISYGSNQRSAKSRALGGVVDPHVPEHQFEHPYGPLAPISYYAMAAQKYLHRYGVTREQLAEVAVAAREWALLNPKAYRYNDGPLTAQDVLDSRMISTPLTTADCCLVTDGGAAAIVTSLERARDLRRPPVVVLGYGESGSHMAMATGEDITTSGAVDSGAAAFARAGLTPADVDVAQLYDSFTITVLLSLEGLGFCPRGTAAEFIADGRIRPGGEFPLNTSGGGLSYCHPGMFGLLLIVEAVRQLRGESGERQVAGAQVTLAHGTGGILSTSSTVLLGVDR